MIHPGPSLVVDIDGTLCPIKGPNERYEDLLPHKPMVDQLRAYRARGFNIILQTSRNMRTFDGNLGRINAETAPVLLAWLKRHEIPFDEIHFGKPWPGRGGFYVDDRAVRPDEFLGKPYEELMRLVGHD